MVIVRPTLQLNNILRTSRRGILPTGVPMMLCDSELIHPFLCRLVLAPDVCRLQPALFGAVGGALSFASSLRCLCAPLVWTPFCYFGTAERIGEATIPGPVCKAMTDVDDADGDPFAHLDDELDFALASEDALRAAGHLQPGFDEVAATFVPPSKFLGARPGAAFRLGALGLGYYADGLARAAATAADMSAATVVISLEDLLPCEGVRDEDAFMPHFGLARHDAIREASSFATCDLRHGHPTVLPESSRRRGVVGSRGSRRLRRVLAHGAKKSILPIPALADFMDASPLELGFWAIVYANCR